MTVNGRCWRRPFVRHMVETTHRRLQDSRMGQINKPRGFEI